MSQENVELVRQMVNAWNRGDYEVARVEEYLDRAEALEAVGLRE